MAKLFNLKILTPERKFYDGPAEAVTVTVLDGKLTILADHAPLVTPLEVSTISYKLDGEWVEAFGSAGFMEVHHEGVGIYVQACEWPHEIDEHRAEEALRRAEELLRQKRSLNEYKQSKIALARAMERLRITKTARPK